MHPAARQCGSSAADALGVAERARAHRGYRRVVAEITGSSLSSSTGAAWAER